MKISIRAFLVLLSFFALLHSEAQNVRTLKGTIQDTETKEPIVGALIFVENESKPLAESGLDGSFVLKKIPSGNVKLKVSYVGYRIELINIGAEVAEVLVTPISLSKNRLDEVSVKGIGKKQGDAHTYQLDRNSPNLQNSVSARAIEISPDLSVANVAQRVSGVSMERSSNGEGQYVILRGMDKRYSYTLINGVKIPSPDNKNRYVPLDIFPSSMLERLEITKSLTPNMEGDAIGGMVNMVMKNAPKKFEFTADAAIGGTNASFNKNTFTTFDKSQNLDKSPRYTNGSDYNATMKDFPMSGFSYGSKKNPINSLFNLSLGGRLFNNKLGVLVAGSFQNNYKTVNTVFFGTETDSRNSQTILDDIKIRKYAINQKRSGIHARLDYKINEKNSINLYAGWMNLVRNEYRSQIDTSLSLNRTIDSIGRPGLGRISISTRGLYDNQTIWNTTLSGKHDLGNGFDVDWIASYSEASDNRPDLATLSISTGVQYNKDSNRIVVSPLTIDGANRIWYYSSDKDKSGYLNFHYKKQIGEISSVWSVGGMYRNKGRESSYDEYKLTPTPAGTPYNGNIYDYNFNISNPAGSGSNALNYSATENVASGYAMTNLSWKKWELVGGARYEHTHLSWLNNISDDNLGKVGDKKYYDILPSGSLNYNINEKQSIKAAYFSGISRPNFYEVIPHNGTDQDADYNDLGNPNLKSTTSNNYDIRYGIYPKGLDHFLFGLFFKRIKDPIEYALETVGSTKVYYTPKNFGIANNKGFEFDAVKFWRWFGIKANYTYTDSKISTKKIYRYLDSDKKATQDSVFQNRPLQGQSKHIANISLLVKDDVHTGINAQLAFNYTGKRINTVSEFLDNDVWQKGFVQMDFSIEKKIKSHWVVYGKANNLLNTAYELYVPQKLSAAAQLAAAAPYQTVGKNVFVRKEKYGMFGLIGVRYKF